MASYTIAAGERASHDRHLAADTADTVTFANTAESQSRGGGLVEVLSDGAAAVYVSVDGTTAAVSGSHCYKLPAGAPSTLQVELPAHSSAVSLISAGTPFYSVTKVNWL